ncbi:hypothetical protein V6N11_082386 [Hibiscus sabdariffa]|uniref:Uncharacterized protein n=1 Tax=Hibiscus sabdariffa TaxID=183260 RepID=A0ABR2PCQ3_9ROSI
MLLHIATITPLIPSFPNASVAWNGEAFDSFSIWLAYKLCTGEVLGDEAPLWKNGSSQISTHHQGFPSILTESFFLGRWYGIFGWIKINTNDTRRSQDGLAMCGGVAHDHTGAWRFGYS